MSTALRLNTYSAAVALLRGQGGAGASPITAIAADGWRATYPDPPPLDPEGSPETLTVTRQGFDATGAATTVDDTLTIMSRVREPYPSQTVFTADTVSLSEFVYAGDTIPGVINNSSRAYPKPVAMWITPDRQHVKGSTFTFQLAVAHAHARNGKPVAASKIRVSDGSDTVEVLQSEMSATTFSATGLSVSIYSFDVDFSTLTQGALCEVDADIFPWVGEKFTISTDADPYPSPNLTTLRVLNDREGTYGTAYAYVDASSGDDGTAVVSETPATAQASPYLTIAAAVAGIETYNNANFGRANDTGGGIVRLEPGVHVHSSYRTVGASKDVPVVIEAADPAQKGATVYTDPGSHTLSGVPDMLRLRTLVMRKTGSASTVFLDTGGGGAERKLFLEDITFEQNGTGAYGGWLFRLGVITFLNCDGDNFGQANPLGPNFKTANAIGCTDAIDGGALYNAIGGNSGLIIDELSAGDMPDRAGTFYGFNKASKRNPPNPVLRLSVPIGERGMAFVGNIIEVTGSLSTPSVSINADTNTDPLEGLVEHHNTVVGERENGPYSDVPGFVEKSGSVRGNLWFKRNLKGDVFAASSDSTGNMSLRLKVAGAYNASIDGASNAGSYGPSYWGGEIAGLGEQLSADPDFVDDQSSTAGDAGGGDYRQGPASTVGPLPAAYVAYPYDLNGDEFRLDGTAKIGACQG